MISIKHLYEDVGSVMYRGMRDVDTKTLSHLIGQEPQDRGVVDIKKKAGKSHKWWTTNPRVAMIYATTPAVSKGKGEYQVLMSASVPPGHEPEGKIGAVTDPVGAVISRIAYMKSSADTGDELQRMLG